MSHPGDEQILGFVFGQLGEDERSNLELHLVTCLKCCDRVTQAKQNQNKTPGEEV